MTKGCLYCGLQLPDNAEFCPREGPLEEGELERAAQWAEQVFEQFEVSRSIRTGG